MPTLIEDIAPAADETIRLAEENHRLAEENRRLRQTERRREVAYFLAELRDSGQLTPAIERAGVEDALIAAEEQPLSVTLPDGRTVPLSAVLKELLRALPVAYPQGELAPAAATAPALTPEELAVAQALGLSAEEYTGSSQ
jgi:phage I-like protein